MDYSWTAAPMNPRSLTSTHGWKKQLLTRMLRLCGDPQYPHDCANRIGAGAFEYEFGALDDSDNLLAQTYRNLLYVSFDPTLRQDTAADYRSMTGLTRCRTLAHPKNVFFSRTSGGFRVASSLGCPNGAKCRVWSSFDKIEPRPTVSPGI